MKKLIINKESGKNFFKNVKASFSGRKFRSGAYVTMVSAIVIVMVLVVNMFVSKLNIELDLSTQNMYTLSEDTKNMLKDLKDDITIYYMVQTGSETEVFQKIAKKYDTLSDKITLESKDPVLYPKFASQYVEDEVAENSFIVVNNTTGTAKYVANSDMLVQELNYQTYSYDTTGIDVEGQLTSAIQYVTSTELPVMYVVEGHGETEIGDSFNSSADKMNVSVETLATLSTDSIPEDCDMLYINAPQKDFSDEETTMIKNYLSAGGKAVITLNYNSAGLTNFLSILDYYGIEMVDGIVMEGDANMHMTNYPHYLVPTLESHDITANASNNQIPVLMPVCSGLAISDTLRSSLTVEPLMTTSDSAYAKVGTEFTTYEKEDGDINGPFYLGLAATDTYNGVTSQIVVYSTELTFDEGTSQYGNSDLLSGTISYLSGDTGTLSIPTKSVTEDQVYPSQEEALLWGFVVVVLLPVGILIAGIMVCLKRRKK